MKKIYQIPKSAQILILILFPVLIFGQKNVTTNLAKYMQGQVEVNNFSGTVLVTKNGSVLLKKAYGLADYEWNISNTIDTKFGLASVTKHFTAIAILQLVEKGKLSLNDKLNKFFPDYPKGDSITIHMLLTHTSGLVLDFDELYMDHTAISKDSALIIIKKKPYLFPPGTSCKYSNIGYFLLSEIIEKSSGESYAGYLRKYIFDIADMKNTGVSNNDSIISSKARIYCRTGKGFVHNPYINWNLCIGLDGLYSTVEDLYKLDRALYGESLLSENSKLKMTTQHNKKYLNDDFLETYGYGIFINPYYNHKHYLLTHSGGFNGVMTSFDRFTDDNVFIAILSNNQSESHMISYGLSGIVFNIPVEIPYKHKAITIDTTQYKNYAGKYGKIEIIKMNGRLFWNNSDTELLPESETKFFRADNNDRTIEFVANKQNIITSLILTKGGVKEIILKDKQGKSTNR